MRRPPSHYRDADLSVMTNFDHSIDRRLEARLRQEPVIVKYTGRHFCGEVWWQDQQFHCLIRVWGVARNTVSAATLEEIMSAVCSEYGTE